MEVHLRRFPLRLRHTFRIARGASDVVEVVFCELEHRGVRGVGEASPSRFYGESPETVEAALEELRDFIRAADPTKYHHVVEDARERLGKRRAALCALDCALHDWAARAFGTTLHRLLGLDPGRLPPTSFTIGIDTPERMVEKLLEAGEQAVFKIKLGAGAGVETVRELRRHTAIPFRVDANCAWTAAETIEYSRELEALGVEFIEQPLPPDQDEAMEEVYRKSALPVFADESAVIPEDVPKLPGRFHGVNIKLVKCGGISEALRMVHLARTFGLRVMFGCMIESSAGITAAAEIGALADHLDLDGNVLITNDPYRGAVNRCGRLELPERGVEPR